MTLYVQVDVFDILNKNKMKITLNQSKHFSENTAF